MPVVGWIPSADYCIQEGPGTSLGPVQ
jgi:hypothetical protein